jgi:hypothetical protein
MRFKFLCNIPVLRAPLPIRLLTAVESTVTNIANNTTTKRKLTIVGTSNSRHVSEPI